jgi:phosphoadenosine phosphosulfate reductase
LWCKVCDRETPKKICEICGSITEEEKATGIFWCPQCNTPIIREMDAVDKEICPICGSKVNYLCADLRPVFPEERLLLEILLERPLKFLKSSVWANKSKYYIDGKSVNLPSSKLNRADIDSIIEKLEAYKSKNSYKYFDVIIDKFIKTNKVRLNSIKNEAYNFIQNVASKYPSENIVASFSGGKDSTVTADLAVRALGNPSLVHIFGNTTLEFPLTTEYADRFRKAHPFAIFKVAKNKEQDFYKVCEDIGPPARMMRWCCSMFKTGPITRVLNSLYKDKHILTFYGIRKCESVSRSKYNRVEGDTESVKIQKQTVASPIFFWNDIDIWLYILGEKIDFNDAYRLGYDRVGCWCCPNNSGRSQFLSQVYMPEQCKKWRDFLITFAKRIGKPDPEVYVDSGKWKARQGGNGVKAADDVKLKFTNCTAEEHAKIYSLNKPINDDFIGMFVPFGIISKELGRKLIKETIVLDVNTNVPILSIQPFVQSGYEYSVKVKTMNVADHDDLQRMAGYQIRKYNACRKCLKCESLCRHGAISIIADRYLINDKKCKRCKMCVTAKYLAGGCMMDKYLRRRN